MLLPARPLLLVLLSVLPAALARVVDVPETLVNVTIPRPSDHAEPVTVTVSRLDELVDTSTGDLLAARIVDVAFRFDVDTAPDTTHPVRVNSHPVPLGISRVDVTTSYVASAFIADVLPRELIEMAFDVGMAKVEVSATEEALLMGRDANGHFVQQHCHHPHADKRRIEKHAMQNDHQPEAAPVKIVEHVPVRRIRIRVHVLAVNDVKVEQIDIVEQILDILPTGSVLRAPPARFPVSSDPAVIAAIQARREAHRRHCIAANYRHRHRIVALWARLPRPARIGLAAFLATLMFLAVFVAIPLAVYVHWKERRQGYVRVEGLNASERGLPTIPEEDEEEICEKARLA